MEVKKKILVLGSSGLLGSYLLKKLSKKHNLFSSSRNTNKDFIFNLPTFESDLSTFINLNSIDYVINTVGCTDVDLCEENPQLAYELNSKLPGLVHNSIKNSSKECKQIYISTDSFYSFGNSTELDVIPENIYSLTKLHGEKFANSQSAIILRTNFFGKSVSKNKKSFSDWILESLKKGEKINGFEDVIFSPISLDRLCYCISLILDNPIPGVFNVGALDSISKYEFCLRVAEKYKFSPKNIKPVKASSMELAAKRSNNMSMNSEKFFFDYSIKNKYIGDDLENLA
tara:strand:- start:15177 stop:16034 length:858 start_codon:yes stop_codon:yes gene_type:complete